MADYTLEKLISDLSSNKYIPKTQDELKQQAQNRYQSVYDQKRLEANQAQQRSDLALRQKEISVARDYQKALDESIQNYKQAYSDAGRQQLRRGMQRSSYGAQTLANIQIAGNKAADQIGETRTDALINIADQRSLLAQQLAEQLKSYSGQQAADILAYMDELESKEYQRQTDANRYANSLASQIYEYAQREKQNTVEQQRWLDEFNLKSRQLELAAASKASGGGGGRGSGSSSYSSSNNSTIPAASPSTGGTGDSRLIGALNVATNTFKKNSNITTNAKNKATNANLKKNTGTGSGRQMVGLPKKNIRMTK